MRYRRRSVNYDGEPFSFERVDRLGKERRRVTWAVSHRGEFIGTMASPEEITTKDFDLRCAHWLKDLLGSKR
jgi:hypothetical protein